MQPIDRHGLLADPTRRAILQALRQADQPLDVRAIAGNVGLHPNSVREQLSRLERAGMVRVEAAAPSGRGRPGLRYRLSPLADEVGEPWRIVGTALADELMDVPGADAVWSAAGERWGRRATIGSAAVRPMTRNANDAGRTPPDVMDVITDLMDEAGFAPDRPDPTDRSDLADTELRLRACPFLPLERRHMPVVCGMHLGFIRGALRELGSSREAVSIEPFVRPGLCVATIGSPTHD